MRVLALAFAVLLPGCLGPALDGAPAGGERDGVVAHAAGSVLALPAPFANLAFRLVETGATGGEPTLGVAKDGTLFVAGVEPETFPPTRTEDAVSRLLRSRDHGATWEPVGDLVRDPKVNADPWMWLDPSTDRIYNVPLYIACSWATWSDDLGETWETNPVAGCVPPDHDHQKLTTGPPVTGVTTRGYPNVVYYAYNSLVGALIVARPPVALPRLGTFVSVSYDGGATFEPGIRVHPSDPCHVGINGPVAVSSKGVALLPKPICDGVAIVRSTDSGASWTVAANVTGAGGLDDFAWDPDVAFDANDVAYLVWTGADGLVYLSWSADEGLAWSAPVPVTPPQVRATVFSVVSAGDPGRVAIAYLGTERDPAGWPTIASSEADNETVWHLYTTYALDARATAPTFVTARVTPEDDPVQIGCVWMRGGASECRNLLDFIDMVIDGEGRVHVSFTDGCDRCTSASASRREDLVLAVASGGPSLFERALGAWPPAVRAR